MVTMLSKLFETFLCWIILNSTELALPMWGDQAKWVWTCKNHIFSLLLDVMLHSKSYILKKTTLKSDTSLQSYKLLKRCQNKRKH